MDQWVAHDFSQERRWFSAELFLNLFCARCKHIYFSIQNPINVFTIVWYDLIVSQWDKTECPRKRVSQATAVNLLRIERHL